MCLGAPIWITQGSTSSPRLGCRKFPVEETAWPSSGLRRVSVNSFGFGGSNSHVVLDDALHYLQERGLRGNHSTVADPGTFSADRGTQACTPNGAAVPKLPKLLVWSAADEGALKRTTQAYELYYEHKIAGDPLQLDRLAFTLAARRSRMLWRAFSIVADGAETRRLPRAKPTRSSAEVALAFVFTGQGAQYANMGSDLRQYPVFDETLRRVDSIYRGLGAEWSLFGKINGAVQCFVGQSDRHRRCWLTSASRCQTNCGVPRTSTSPNTASHLPRRCRWHLSSY